MKKMKSIVAAVAFMLVFVPALHRQARVMAQTTVGRIVAERELRPTKEVEKTAVSAGITDRSGYWVSVNKQASVRRFPGGPEVKPGFRLSPGQYFHLDPQGGNAQWALGFACPNGGRYCNSRENLQGFILRGSLGNRVSVNSSADSTAVTVLASSDGARRSDTQMAGARYLTALLSTNSAATGTASVQGEEAQAASLPCDNNLWKHVYSPERLHVMRRCVTLTGTVVYRRLVSDGDVHILLNLDPHLRHAPYINARNRSQHNGDLVVELICKGTPHGDAINACGNYHQPIPIPDLWTRYAVTGALVQDYSRDHGWMEIHPVSHMVRAPRQASLDAPSGNDTQVAEAHYMHAPMSTNSAATNAVSLALDSERRVCARDIWLRDDRLHPIGLLHQGDRFVVERYTNGSGNKYDVWALGRAYGPGVNPQGKRGRLMAKYLCQ